MSKETAQRITFKDLIAKKQQREHDKFEIKDIYVETLDKAIPFKKPNDDQLLDALDTIGDNEDVKRTLEAFDLLIYKCCDMLQDGELQKELEVVDPLDTVKTIFELNERLELGKKLVDWSEIEKKVEKIKN